MFNIIKNWIKKYKNENEKTHNYLKKLYENENFLNNLNDNDVIKLFNYLINFCVIIKSDNIINNSKLNKFYNNFFSYYQEVIDSTNNIYPNDR